MRGGDDISSTPVFVEHNAALECHNYATIVKAAERVHAMMIQNQNNHAHTRCVVVYNSLNPKETLTKHHS
jgi:hypothetical protein